MAENIVIDGQLVEAEVKNGLFGNGKGGEGIEVRGLGGSEGTSEPDGNYSSQPTA